MIDRLADDAHRFRLVGRIADVVSAEPDQGDLLPGAAEGAIEHFTFADGGWGLKDRRLRGDGGLTHLFLLHT
jgi:hypothetical protein